MAQGFRRFLRLRQSGRRGGRKRRASALRRLGSSAGRLAGAAAGALLAFRAWRLAFGGRGLAFGAPPGPASGRGRSPPGPASGRGRSPPGAGTAAAGFGGSGFASGFGAGGFAPPSRSTGTPGALSGAGFASAGVSVLTGFSPSGVWAGAPGFSPGRGAAVRRARASLPPASCVRGPGRSPAASRPGRAAAVRRARRAGDRGGARRRRRHDARALQLAWTRGRRHRGLALVGRNGTASDPCWPHAHGRAEPASAGCALRWSGAPAPGWVSARCLRDRR